MLKSCRREDLLRIADLAGAARRARDRILSEVTENRFWEPQPVRGPHDPIANLGLDPLPPRDPSRLALEAAVSSLSDAGRCELQAVVWIGRGDYAARQWDAAISAARDTAGLSVASLADNADLHDQITKGLYEIEERRSDDATSQRR